MYVVFFFFKQKTAYEMRISDWSSDVCSSDLVSQLRLVANTIAHSSDCLADAPNGRYWPLSNASISTSITGPVMPWLSSMKQTPSRACEIGRTSWRERVCQYV